MIDTDKYEGHLMDGDFQVWCWSSKMLKTANYEEQMATAKLLKDVTKLLAEVKRLQKENKILAKYMDIVQKYDDALLADGDTDPRWSELYD